MSKPTITVTALQLQDVPAAAQLSADAFVIDRQTEMKELGKEPFSMKQEALGSLPAYINHPRCVVIKAVDEETGDLMGYCTWGFRGIKPDEMPVVEGRVQPQDTTPAPAQNDNDDEQTTQTEESAEVEADADAAQEPESDPIKRLVALTDSDMNAWMEETMPEGTRCIYVVGLSVAPKFQGRGVGTALLRWGTNVCDDKGIFAWVHSSMMAWEMYQKTGFEVIRKLDIDLDEYAPCAPPNEGPGAKWGHYVFRYMKYFGKQKG